MELQPGQKLSETLTVENSPILFGCRTGICGTCLVEVEAEDMDVVPPRTEAEKEFLATFCEDRPRARLACQMAARGHMDLKIRKIDM
ncbi:MAG: (2Fe-2S)-binding protein [Bdellovibrionales bacterium]|nr:(2Fe-2S)-binding protein [Bdellovibrionales bacterium]